jgi:hypothetical protein
MKSASRWFHYADNRRPFTFFLTPTAFKLLMETSACEEININKKLKRKHYVKVRAVGFNISGRERTNGLPAASLCTN